MNGADSLVQTLTAGGVEACFANPGTSEMHFMAALDQATGMRCVLGLSEGVVTGAADGYARMRDQPAITLLHCGPGLANGMSNLHNARRAGSSILNLIGDQATYHRPLDPPLSADTENWARGVSRFVRTSMSAQEVGRDAAIALQAARADNGTIASLILPSDVCWGEGGVTAPPLPLLRPIAVDERAVASAASVLRGKRGRSTVLLLGGHALRAEGLRLASTIAEKTGARLFAPTANGRIERGRGRHPVRRMPYVIEQAVEALAGTTDIILIGATRPVGFFAYPGKPQTPEPDGCAIHLLARAEEDLIDALMRLAKGVSAGETTLPDEGPRVEPATGAVTSENVGQTVAALLPDNAIVIDESVSFGRSFFAATQNAAPHDWLQLTGGAIGEGIPLAIGAAVAAPGRRVVALQADGSAMFTIAGLWTQARERLDVTTVVLSNRKYAILLGELANVGARSSRVATDMFNLSDPHLDWVSLAAGFGLEAVSVDTMAGFADVFASANRRRGPFLIELVI